jgi:hypothetical protein
MRYYLAPVLLLLMFVSEVAPARLTEASDTGANSEDVKTLVIDKVVINKTPRDGPWLLCFTVSHGVDEVTFNVPNKQFEGSGVEIALGVEISNVRSGDGVRWDMKLDGDQADVCSVEAENRSSGNFKATLRGSRVFNPTGNWNFVMYWHLE